ncbi:hypothetical protein [Sediminicola luteus]
MRYINLENLENISRGDDKRLFKYLIQFRELIPERTAQLQNALQLADRVQIRQILHKMSPQLQFFGITNVVDPIQRLECEYQTMAIDELNTLVTKILVTLEKALIEVSQLIDYKQNNQNT